MTPDETEHAARRAAAAFLAKLCPHCGQPLIASVPAADAQKDVSGDRGVVPMKGANVTDEDAPSGYMSREKML